MNVQPPPYGAGPPPGPGPTPGHGYPPGPGPAPGHGSPYPHPGHPIHQPQPPYPINPVTGAAAWWLGLITLVGFLIFGNIFGVVALVICRHQTKNRWPAGARTNVRNSLNWQLSYALYSVVLLGVHVALLFLVQDHTQYQQQFFPVGIAITLYAVVSVYHLVMTIVCGVRAGKGRVVSIPGTIPFIRN